MKLQHVAALRASAAAGVLAWRVTLLVEPGRNRNEVGQGGQALALLTGPTGLARSGAGRTSDLGMAVPGSCGQ